MFTYSVSITQKSMTYRDTEYLIVLFKSLRNCKRGNKGKFTLKSNSNKIMLSGGGGNIILF